MRINIDCTIVDDSLRYIYRGELFTGELVELNANGVVIELSSVIDGIRHGTERSWYPDGTLKEETELVSGIATGVSRQWHSNGQLAEECEFDSAGDHISKRQWSETGELTNSENWPHEP